MLTRMYEIVKILKEATSPLNGIRIQELLEETGIQVDIKTVRNSIIKINEMTNVALGYSLINNKKKHGYLIENNYFSDGELQFLMDVVLTNGNLNLKSKNRLEQKLALLSTARQMSRLNPSPTENGAFDYDLLLNLTTVIKAINNKTNLIFKYITYDVQNGRLSIVENQRGNRTVNGHKYYMISPYRIVMDNSNYYILGYYDKRPGTLSVYRIDRMRLIQTYKGKFIASPPKQEIDNYLKNNVNMYIAQKSQTLEFNFSQKIIREIGTRFGDKLWVEKVGDQYHGVINDVNITEGLIGWILMLNTEIEIVKPTSLKNQIKVKIDSLTKMYQ